MKKVKSLILVTLAILVLAIPVARAQNADVKTRGLFVNLTTDDTWSAAKAISFAHQKALKNGHKPVAIWLNVRAVYLADKKTPIACAWTNARKRQVYSGHVEELHG